MLQQLREHTQESHQRLEGRLDILDQTLSLDRYRDLVARFYGFYAPLEPCLDTLCHTELPELQFPQRRKLHLLVQDLEALGMSGARIDALPRCSDLPTLQHPPQALGCLYVLEGSTLGGQIISRHLRSVHGLEAENGAAFFQSYGPQVGAMWRAFGCVLNAYPIKPAEEPVLLGAARETFATLEKWLCDE